MHGARAFNRSQLGSTTSRLTGIDTFKAKRALVSIGWRSKRRTHEGDYCEQDVSEGNHDNVGSAEVEDVLVMFLIAIDCFACCKRLCDTNTEE